MTVTLHLGDCLEVMRGMADGCIDLTVTSPPYDNLRTYKGYTFDFEPIARELYRVTKPGGVVVWVVGDATVNGSETGTSFRQALYFKECGFNLHDTMIWQKSKMPNNHNRYEQGFEYMFVFGKGTPKTFNGIRDKANARSGDIACASYRDIDGTVKKTSAYKKKRISEHGLRLNIWPMPGVMSNIERQGHPAPFPEALARDHILSWSNEGDTVLDCFLGSGTTGKMAVKYNRNFVGIEISGEYLDMARRRIADAQAQPTLFQEVQP